MKRNQLILRSGNLMKRRLAVTFKKNLVCLTLLIGYFTDSNAQSVVFDWVNQIAGVDGTTFYAYCGEPYKSKTLAIDKSGNIYNVGDFSGVVDFDPGVGVNTLNQLNGRHFVSKFDNKGSLIWVKQLGSATTSVITAISVDASGDILLGGYFEDKFNLDPGSGSTWVTSAGQNDIFIIKLDSSGQYIWGKRIGDANDEKLNGIATDQTGNIFATGIIHEGSGNSDDDDDGGAPADFYAYALKLNGTGGIEWEKRWKGAEGRAIITDSGGNILITGDFSGKDRDFNPGAGTTDTFLMSSLGDVGVFISKLNSAGNFIWARQIGGEKADQGFSISTDESGAVYTCGIFTGKADLDPGPGVFSVESYLVPNTPSPSYFSGAFILKLDSSGAFRWARQLNASVGVYAWSVATGIQQAGGIYATGYFGGSLKFFQPEDTIETTTANPPAGEGFIVKLDTSGKLEWMKKNGGNLSCTIIVDDTGNVYTGGSFSKLLNGGITINDTVNFDPHGSGYKVAPITTNANGFIHKMKWCSLSDTIIESTCKPFVYENITYKESGFYTLPNPNGCDSSSKIVLSLTFYKLDPVININENELGTTEPYSTYQWLQDGNLINGANDSTYKLKENGDYQVIVTNEDGCIDTSDTYAVRNIVGIESHELQPQIKIYPNPAYGTIYIDASLKVSIILTTMEGKILRQNSDTKQISIGELPESIYLLYITDENNNLIKVEKIIKTFSKK